MKSTSIQKLKQPGDHPIAPETRTVLFRAGAGVTRAMLPAAKSSLERELVAVRANPSTSPTIVHKVRAVGGDKLLVHGRGLVDELELIAYGEAVTLTAIEPGVWLARASRGGA